MGMVWAWVYAIGMVVAGLAGAFAASLGGAATSCAYLLILAAVLVGLVLLRLRGRWPVRPACAGADRRPDRVGAGAGCWAIPERLLRRLGDVPDARRPGHGVSCGSGTSASPRCSSPAIAASTNNEAALRGGFFIPVVCGNLGYPFERYGRSTSCSFALVSANSSSRNVRVGGLQIVQLFGIGLDVIQLREILDPQRLVAKVIVQLVLPSEQGHRGLCQRQIRLIIVRPHNIDARAGGPGSTS